MIDDTTICAVASPPGVGAIAVLRLSGHDAYSIVDQVFKPIRKGKKVKDSKPYTMRYGSIVDQDKVIDDVILSLFRSPNSYTGEDAVEISCHGSTYIQQAILQLLIRHGARLAKPGEFTLRAFLNKKLDLSQAEAVADLIASSSRASHSIAMNQMRGGFTDEIARLRDQLLHLASLIELELDFSEEDVEFASRDELKKLIDKIGSHVNKLLHSFETGNAIKNGIPVVIAGLPNVGKSTLLNALLNEERAIVSEIPGTTRDAIEDIIDLNGVTFRFIDTAGLRKTKDKIETIGISKTYEKIGKARVIILMVNLDDNIQNIEKQIKSLNIKNDQRLILAVNKIDLKNSEGNEKYSQTTTKKFPGAIFISAKSHKNLEELKNVLINSVLDNNQDINDVLISNTRHYEAFMLVAEGIKRIEEGMGKNLGSDFLAMDIRQILHYLGEITGQITTDEILGNIFKNFCIGK